MNDSFLEDLELVSNSPNTGITVRQPTRHVATRKVPSENYELQKSSEDRQKFGEAIVLNSAPVQRQEKDVRKDHLRRSYDKDTKQQVAKTKVSVKVDKVVESRSKPVEVKRRSDPGDDAVLKPREDRLKVPEGKVILKDRSRRSGSVKQSTSSASSKENSRPSDSPKENYSNDALKDKQRQSEGCLKNTDSKELYSVALLKSIKELVSTYTKQETGKILRAMQDLHMHSQATLIKQLLLQTEDLTKEMQPSSDSARIRNLLEENGRLREEIVLLQLRNEELQKKVQELECVKQEYVNLKLKCKEI